MMKKFATGFLAAALSLGLAACTEEENTVGDAEDLNQMESPAAGGQAQPGYDEGMGQGTMDQGIDEPPTLEQEQNMGTPGGSMNEPQEFTPEGEQQQDPMQ